MRKLYATLLGAAVGLALAASSGVAQEAVRYGDHMGTMPAANVNRASMSGRGMVSATLADNTLTIEGTFEGLKSPATGVAVFAGETGQMGVDQVKTATNIGTIAAADVSGSFSGTVELTDEQIALLNGNGIFVVVQTEANPGGEIRGWLVSGNG